MSNAPVGSPCRCGGTFIAHKERSVCNRCGTFDSDALAQERQEQDSAALRTDATP